MSLNLHVGQAGFQAFIAKEAGTCVEKGPGWALCEGRAEDLAFSHLVLHDPVELKAEPGRGLGGSLAELFRKLSRGVRYDGLWPLAFESAAEEGLSKRAKSLEAAFRGEASQLARIMRLARSGRPGPGPCSGFFVFLAGFDRAFACGQAWCGGQRRMADDPHAPSRSYLKVEEAYAVLGEAPAPGQTVADLGAAPGGWSYSAARRGAAVTAVDNGPLKDGASGNPLITHLREDAFKFAPESQVDWLFCDLLEDPARTLGLLERWAGSGWCGRFVANLKFGRNDPLPLLRKVLARDGVLAGRCALLRARHLYHDREEFTVVGRLA
ncbi:MAG: rRNA methyltransferase [Elusimicrobia bacterium]|nr:rRNA methyltransferase [Elusimicrobiota bacterium]